MLTNKSIAIVIACYNDAGTVQEMLKRIHASMKEVTPNYEIIYVNDASPDNAEQVLNEALIREPRLTVITHSRNFGSQNVFTSGICKAKIYAATITSRKLYYFLQVNANIIRKIGQ